MTGLTTSTMVILEGGPRDLPKRVVPGPILDGRLKIQFRGGYEHFEATDHRRETPFGVLTVYEWTLRTEMAE
ncbi:hypothetical protein GCM10012275_52410 [Longimycelium tulufanense]|uniref:Uncharacterized protein n=1 Tax=Longimycelium tulufanense TaxID=907463 RepID=A0A8J3CJB9_9PSEU|nr:DUF5988 family protein [Longimycelium tulufanense]GGM75243.1 hypothetical protein GCM10012275_52410 [Longimycelium tulufanense]